MVPSASHSDAFLVEGKKMKKKKKRDVKNMSFSLFSGDVGRSPPEGRGGKWLFGLSSGHFVVKK